MLKEPRPGRVKTRLAADIGAVRAAGWYRRQVVRLLRATRDLRWRTVLSVAPDPSVAGRVWPAGIERWPQGPGDLGRRMTRALRRAGPVPVLLVGGDVPGIDRGAISEGFAALRGARTVLGPATDGGFWLIGLRRGTLPPPGWLDGVPWSQAGTLAATRQRAEILGPVALIRELSDVDRADDLGSAGWA